jgi:hypothetical protein
VTRALAAAAVATGVLLLAACGSMPDPRAPRHAFTSADQRAAKLVDVQRGDVPATYSPHGSQKTGSRQCAPDLSDLTLTGADLSKPFIASDAFGYVLGEVDVYRSPEQAATAFARVTGETRRRCLLQIARRALAQYQAGRVRIAPLSLPVGIPVGGLVARRVAESWRDSGKAQAQSTDDVYLLFGRTFVIVSFWHYGAAFPAAAETGLIAAVAGRAHRVSTPPAARTRPGGNTSRGD